MIETTAVLSTRPCFFIDRLTLSKSLGLNGIRLPSVRESGGVRRFESKARTLSTVHARAWLAEGRCSGIMGLVGHGEYQWEREQTTNGENDGISNNRYE
jgi:hypothetical protein